VLCNEAGDVVAAVVLQLTAAGADRAIVEFLAVARDSRERGLARLIKRAAVAHARELGLRTLQTLNHADNTAICRLNEQLGWSEQPVKVQLRAPVHA
jgi:GNAT superfamily N-acetyltransferase